jgi:hypothetical protein
MGLILKGYRDEQRQKDASKDETDCPGAGDEVRSSAKEEVGQTFGPTQRRPLIRLAV